MLNLPHPRCSLPAHHHGGRCGPALCARLSWAARSGVQPDAPTGGDGLPWLDPMNPVARLESVWWAGHGFHSQALAAAVRAERVPRVQLDEGIGAIHPQLGASPVWPVQPDPRSAVAVTGKVGEGEIDALIAQLPARRKV